VEVRIAAPIGYMAEAPTPCKIRKLMSIAADSERAEPAEASVKIKMPYVNILFLP
jgi:hypothetical protein